MLAIGAIYASIQIASFSPNKRNNGTLTTIMSAHIFNQFFRTLFNAPHINYYKNP